jgi:hypothetical protein
MVTKWKKTKDGLEAVETTKYRIDINGMPSLANLTQEEAWLMSGLFNWESENVDG